MLFIEYLYLFIQRLTPHRRFSKRKEYLQNINKYESKEIKLRKQKNKIKLVIQQILDTR